VQPHRNDVSKYSKRQQTFVDQAAKGAGAANGCGAGVNGFLMVATLRLSNEVMPHTQV